MLNPFRLNPFRRYRTVAVLILVASWCVINFGEAQARPRARSRYRQQYNSALREQGKIVQQQNEAFRKLQTQRQAALAAEAARKLESRKAAADAERQRKEEAHEKAKAHFEKQRATPPARTLTPATTSGSPATAPKDSSAK